MLKISFLLTAAFGIVFVRSSFKDTLYQNVNRYKQNNFKWNVRHVGNDNHISLRKMEEQKDREFKAYLQQLRSQYSKQLLDGMKAIYYGTDKNQNDGSENTIQTNFNEPKLEVRRMTIPRKIQVMMYYLGENTPQKMMYNDKQESIPELPETMMYSNKVERRNFMMYAIKVPPQMQAMYNADESIPQTMKSDDEIDLDVGRRNVMMFNAEESIPQTMKYDDEIDLDVGRRNGMMFNAEESVPQTMMMPVEEKIPQTMKYDDEIDLDVGRRNVMMFNAEESVPQTMMMPIEEKIPQTMMYDDEIDLDVGRRNVMMFNAEKSVPETMMMPVEEKIPQTMMYDDEIDLDVGRRNVMMFNAEESVPQTMMMPVEEKIPQTMMYDDEIDLDVGRRNVMMFNAEESVPETMMMPVEEKIPQTMMYDDEIDLDVGRRNVMMFNAEESIPQTMMMPITDKIPQTMMYDDEIDLDVGMMMPVEEKIPQTMKYDDEIDLDVGRRNVMMFNSEESIPQTMKYDDEIDLDVGRRNVMMYANKKPLQMQVMMYNDVEDITQTLIYSGKTKLTVRRNKSKRLPDKTPDESKNALEEINKEARFIQNKTNDMDIPHAVAKDESEWYRIVATLVKHDVPMNAEDYFNQWMETVSIFGNNKTARQQFRQLFPAVSVDKVVKCMASSAVFEKLFWPFVFENGFMNQKLGLLGLSAMSASLEDQKLSFYDALETHQTQKIPVSPEKIVLSFNDPDVVDSLNRSGLMETSKEFVDAGSHLFTIEEKKAISSRVNSALHYINDTMPQLYNAISQVIACIAYYKAQHFGFVGGSISSAFGIIWQDPRAYKEQSVPYYAEQIVHEFIHNSLFLADMVHGTFVNSEVLSRVKVYSPTRHELRDFDKTFHASYVSTGVALFHARAGNIEKAKQFAAPLKVSVEGLVQINNEVGVLNESGNAMLQAMVDFLYIVRIM